ncbi:unnamed protein product [Arabidopsis arenosa]|uniref:K Homology domain-containing protein n=1 Tax=Arabidopsis arenosa TaxID=38785 RepID=A0A8S2AFU6_ARAAE|nr:unnamed protein product [Arabidopsis arenosa]CAE6069712.1 unnamed protein product [Arabidopsis arenosa]
MEKLVKFDILCPNSMVGLLKGKNQTNINRIRRETTAVVYTTESARYTTVTVSSLEKQLDDGSPAIDAALAILRYCLETINYERFKLTLLVEGKYRNDLGEDFFGQWNQQTLTVITLNDLNGDTIVEFFGGNHGIRNALLLFMRNLRNKFFD